MKKLIPILATVVALVAGGCAPQVDIEADKAAIEKLYPAWVETVNSRDLEAWASFLAPDARFQPPNQSALKTHEEIVNLYKVFFEDPRFVLDCHQDQVVVAGSGDIAWSRGTCDGTFTGPDGEAASIKTKWLKVWQKQPDGEWKNLVNMWNSDLPAGGAPEGEQAAGTGSEDGGRAYPPVFSQELREHFQMIFVHARLAVPTEDGFDVGSITLGALAEDVDVLRRKLALEKIAVLGASVHGLIALEYGRRFPQHTTHVIMLATPARSLLTFSDGGSDFIPEVKEYFDRDTSEERKAIFKRNLEQLPEKLSQAPPEKQFGVWYAAHAPYFFYDPNYDPEWLFEEYESNPAVFRQVFEVALNGYDVGQVLDETRAPVFLAVGRRDYGAPPYMWEEYEDKPNFSFNLFEKSGHYPMMEERVLFDQKLIEWVNAQLK